MHYINPKGKFICRRKSKETSVSRLIQRTISRNCYTDMVTHPSTSQGRCCLTTAYKARRLTVVVCQQPLTNVAKTLKMSLRVVVVVVVVVVIVVVVRLVVVGGKAEIKKNKKHSKNTDTSTSDLSS